MSCRNLRRCQIAIPYQPQPFKYTIDIMTQAIKLPKLTSFVISLHQYTSYSEPASDDWARADQNLLTSTKLDPPRDIQFSFACVPKVVPTKHDIAWGDWYQNDNFAGDEWRDKLLEVLPLSCTAGNPGPLVGYFHSMDLNTGWRLLHYPVVSRMSHNTLCSGVLPGHEETKGYKSTFHAI